MKLLYGVGITDCTKDEKYTKCHKTWSNMIERCYSKLYQENNKQFQGYTVCDEWLTYSKFRSWYDRNYYEVPGMAIDINRNWYGSNIYGPDTVLFLPRELRKALNSVNCKNASGYAGVCFDKAKGKYKASISINARRVHIGMYNTAHEAGDAYKVEREIYISKMIRDLKGIIPDNVFQILQK